MISIEEAVAQIKAHIQPGKRVKIRTDEALGKLLAEDVSSPDPSPRYTSSAMDGFGIRFTDQDELPLRFKIVGESAAGSRFAGKVQKGEAVRINTGAMLPDGVDTVVRVEDTSEANGEVLIHVLPVKGQDVRYRGEEFDQGNLILKKNTKLSAAHLALLTAVGVEFVEVFDACTVSLVITGSELAAVGQTVAPDQIRDSNMIMISSAVQEAGGSVIETFRVSDDALETEKTIRKASGDIVICTGGISVGRHDHVKDAAAAVGYKEVFWKIKQKPGKPLFFAERGNQLFFGLPGNPVSAFMCFTHYIKPLIFAANGLPFGWPVTSARAGDAVQNNGKRPVMVRVCLDWQDGLGYVITGVEKQGSHMLTSISDSDGYVILEPKQVVEQGQFCEVFCYDSSRTPSKNSNKR